MPTIDESPEPKSFLASKTFWVNALTLIVSALTALIGSDIVPEEWLVLITGIALPIVNIVLRFLTGESVSARGQVRRARKLSVMLAAILVLSLASPAMAQIKGAMKYDAYDPIILEADVSADDQPSTIFFWVVEDPFVFQMLELENGKVVHAWAKPGKYQVQLLVLTQTIVDGKIESKKARHIATVEVVGSAPDPIPDPTPGPNPEPAPTPSAFKAKVEAAVAKIGTAGRSSIDQIASNYTEVAGYAEKDPGSWDPAAMVDAVKTRNLTTLTSAAVAAWRPFLSDLGVAFAEEKLAAGDTAGHVTLFRQVAEVLRDHAH